MKSDMILRNSPMYRARTWSSIAVIGVAVFIGAILPAKAFADAPHDLTITPAVIDEKAKQRDIIKESITITNTSNHNLGLYPTVNNIEQVDGQQRFSPAQNSEDLSASLANWIELSRGLIEIGPGEQKTVDFIIRVNMNAVTGQYHALISFGDGETREIAEGKAPLGSATVNVEVQTDSKQVIQLNKFVSDNLVFTGDDVLFKYQLQNIGNTDVQPTGEIRIYDRKGEEVAAVEVNREGKTVSHDQTAQLASVWAAANGFGKYKAFLTVNYGKDQTASVTDTVYFWVVPWKQLLGLFIAMSIAIIILSLYFHRWFEERHLGQLAHAGLLKVEALAHIHPAAASLPATVPPEVILQAIPRRSIFSFFQRKSSHAVVAAAPIAQPQAAPSPVQAVTAPAPVVSAPVQSQVPSSGTIDLKRMRPQAASSATHSDVSVQTPAIRQVEMQGSVINLKKKQ